MSRDDTQDEPKSALALSLFEYIIFKKIRNSMIFLFFEKELKPSCILATAQHKEERKKEREREYAYVYTLPQPRRETHKSFSSLNTAKIIPS